ncbi:MAG: carboxymuconolactone decarboxylase family protein [Gammaproteobacteria bacterium]|nr:carboxymuconolactone decarboxylase family protein [Gammaproteobacteria bacterium]
MSIDTFKNNMPSYAKDIKLNLASVMTPEGSPHLTQKQIDGIALASSYATKNSAVIQFMLEVSEQTLMENEVEAAKSAATIMAMNNIYYRFIHLVKDDAFKSLPAKLRMNVIANPGIDKLDYELNCLAVSAINGCGMCIEAHTHELIKAGVSHLAIQSAIRIAAVINAAAMTI